jgi:hypothetical protein
MNTEKKILVGLSLFQAYTVPVYKVKAELHECDPKPRKNDETVFFPIKIVLR